MDALLTLDQAAEILQVSTRTVLRWRDAGEPLGIVDLPGRVVRVRSDLLEEWIASRS